MTASATPTRPGARQRLPRWLWALLAVATVAVAVPVAAGVAFVWSFSGGWDGIRPAAEPTDADVVRARDDSAGAISSEHAATLDEVLVAAGGTVLATAQLDTCRKGMNDWKNHDGYTLSCSRTAATAVQLPASATTPEAARAVEQRLLGAGWQPRSFSRSVRSPGAAEVTTALETSSLVPPDGEDEGVGRYLGTGRGTALQVGISTRDLTPIYLPDAAFSDWSGASGRATDVEAAFAAGSGVRLVVLNEHTYFED